MASTQYRVLVVDDMSHVRAIVRRHLDSTKYQVMEAWDKVSFLRLLSTQTFHRIITDLGLPDFDAESLVQAINHFTTYPLTQTIIMPYRVADLPSFVLPPSWDRLHVLEKPFNPKDLGKLLSTLENADSSVEEVSH